MSFVMTIGKMRTINGQMQLTEIEHAPRVTELVGTAGVASTAQTILGDEVMVITALASVYVEISATPTGASPAPRHYIIANTRLEIALPQGVLGLKAAFSTT